MSNRCFAIGDVHGFKLSLEKLLSKLKKDARLCDEDTLVFLGDYIDRGPDGEGVMELVMELEQTRPNSVALLGNHDAWYLERLNKGLIKASRPELGPWLEQRPRHFRWKNYFFSHAPVYRVPQPEILNAVPQRSWESFVSFEDAVLAGYDFLYSFNGFESEDLLHEAGVVGVCGHVHHKNVVIYPDQYVGVDTGAGFGGKLTAIELPTLRTFSVPEIS